MRSATIRPRAIGHDKPRDVEERKGIGGTAVPAFALRLRRGDGDLVGGRSPIVEGPGQVERRLNRRMIKARSARPEGMDR